MLRTTKITNSPESQDLIWITCYRPD